MSPFSNTSKRIGAAIALTVGIWAGGATAQENTIGVLFLDSQGFFGEIQKGILEGAASENITLITDNSESDPVQESNFLDAAIGAGVAAVIISPVSQEASVPAVERVADAGIPVVCYNTCLADEDMERLAGGLVTTDQAELGRGVGGVAADELAGSGQSARIGLLTATATRPASNARQDSLLPWTQRGSTTRSSRTKKVSLPTKPRRLPLKCLPPIPTLRTSGLPMKAVPSVRSWECRLPALREVRSFTGPTLPCRSLKCFKTVPCCGP